MILDVFFFLDGVLVLVVLFAKFYLVLLLVFVMFLFGLTRGPF